MSKNVASLMFVWFFVNFLIAQHGYNAADVLPQQIATKTDENIKTEICPTVSEIQKSDYVKDCDTSLNINTIKKLNDNNLQTYMCIGLFDSYYKICRHGSLQGSKGVVSVLTNRTEFDGAIKQILDKGTKHVPELCEKLKGHSAPSHPKLKDYIDQLDSTVLKNTLVCEKECVDIILNMSKPMCAILQFIDEQLHVKDSDHISTTASEKNTSTLSDASKQVPSVNKVVASDKANATIPQAEKPKAEDKKISEADKKIDAAPVNKKKDTANVPPKNSDEKKKEEASINSLPPKVKNGVEKEQDIGNIKTTMPEEEIRDNGFEENIDSPISEENDPSGGNDPEDTQDLLSKDLPQADEEVLQQRESNLKTKPIEKDDDLHFFGFFTILSLVGIGGCLVYHHKQKIFAMILEGRRSRGSRGRRRPSTANYRKLDSNLEEAVTSQCNSNVTHVIY